MSVVFAGALIFFAIILLAKMLTLGEIDPITLTLFVTIIAVLLAYFAGGKKRRMQKYRKIRIGMSEEEMLSIMGNDYSKSLFQGNCTIYEWILSATSYSASYHGWTHVSERKVTIFVNNGLVDAVVPQNI